MIDFNTKDYNIPAIKRESKLFNLKTVTEFRVYGLAQKYNNPPILLGCNPNSLVIHQHNFSQLKRFFSKRGIPIDMERDRKAEDGKVYIGLRRDLRSHTLLSAAVLQTIVYFLENRLDLDLSFEIPGIPKLVPRATAAPRLKKQKVTIMKKENESVGGLSAV